jgi:hypothetical protein
MLELLVIVVDDTNAISLAVRQVPRQITPKYKTPSISLSDR